MIQIFYCLINTQPHLRAKTSLHELVQVGIELHCSLNLGPKKWGHWFEKLKELLLSTRIPPRNQLCRQLEIFVRTQASS